MDNGIMLLDEANVKTDLNMYLVAICAVLSFACVMLIVLLLYVACARKYRLNWFEKNLLETEETKELTNSQEALVQEVASVGTNNKAHSYSENGKLWTNNSQISDETSSVVDSFPPSPTSSGSFQGVFSLGSAGVPLARNDKQIVLSGSTSSSVKLRIASMQAKLDHTKIDSSLYQKESPGEPEDIRGSIHVTLIYDPIAGILTVHLAEAQELQARDFSGTADPYAKIRLLPDKTNVWQTRIHKKTLNPVFDEDFVFEVRAATLGRHTLEVLLYDFDAYSRHHSIGGAQFPLATIDLSEKADLWRSLGPLEHQDPKVDLGELMVSLAYLPSAERLTVVVIKARNLRVVDDTRNSSDPYVKVCLVHGSKRIKKKKTRVHRNTVSPVINEALTFDIDKETLRKCCVEFYVMHDSLLGASEILGKCKVANTPDCKQEEREFHHEMLHSKTATAQWLTLQEHRNQKKAGCTSSGSRT